MPGCRMKPIKVNALMPQHDIPGAGRFEPATGPFRERHQSLITPDLALAGFDDVRELENGKANVRRTFPRATALRPHQVIVRQSMKHGEGNRVTLWRCGCNFENASQQRIELADYA